jgi:hypothetical protein
MKTESKDDEYNDSEKYTISEGDPYIKEEPGKI